MIKKSSLNNKNIQRDTTKNNNANPRDVNQEVRTGY